jgi:hypothetical protein
MTSTSVPLFIGPLALLPVFAAPANVRNRQARGERRDQGRARSSMTCRQAGRACRVAHAGTAPLRAGLDEDFAPVLARLRRPPRRAAHRRTRRNARTCPGRTGTPANDIGLFRACDSQTFLKTPVLGLQFCHQLDQLTVLVAEVYQFLNLLSTDESLHVHNKVARPLWQLVDALRKCIRLHSADQCMSFEVRKHEPHCPRERDELFTSARVRLRRRNDAMTASPIEPKKASASTQILICGMFVTNATIRPKRGFRDRVCMRHLR